MYIIVYIYVYIFSIQSTYVYIVYVYMYSIFAYLTASQPSYKLVNLADCTAQ